MKTIDKIEILNLIKNEINYLEQSKLNVITFYDLYQLLNKAVNRLNLDLIQEHKKTINGISNLHKCTCLNPQSNCFSGMCLYCNRQIVNDINLNK